MSPRTVRTIGLAAALWPWVAWCVAVLLLGPFEASPSTRLPLVALLVVLGGIAPFQARPMKAAAGTLVLIGMVCLLWSSLRPAQYSCWIPAQSMVPSVQLDADALHVERARAFRWNDDETAEQRWFSTTYDLDRLVGMDFVVSRFGGFEGIAHTLLSFRFDDGRVLAVSPEIRKEEGEDYSPWRGLFRNYELIYVLGDERDVVHLRTNVWGDPVYIHPVAVEPTTARRVLESVARHASRLDERPAFYNTVTASCATALAADIQDMADPPLDLDWRVLLPGFSDAMAFELGLLDTDLDFEATRARNLVTPRASDAAARPDFSRAIRGLPPGEGW